MRVNGKKKLKLKFFQSIQNNLKELIPHVKEIDPNLKIRPPM
jgi:hypothetical protein